MAENIVPINELSMVGLVKDTPNVGLAPNAFTDMSNVRLRDNAVWKMKGEEILTADLNCGTAPSSGSWGKIVYITWWANPNMTPDDGYYIFLIEQKNSGGAVVGHRAFLYQLSNASINDITPTTLNSNAGFKATGNWQSTEFSGGYSIIINNGVDKPHYVKDTYNNTTIGNVPDLAELPGWDSYNVRDLALSMTYLPASSGQTAADFLDSFNLGTKIDFAETSLFVTYKDATNGLDYTITAALSGVSGESGTINGTNYVPAPYPASPSQASGNVYNIYTDVATNSTRIYLGDNIAIEDEVKVYILSRNPVNVRAGVVKAFGDLLVAGNLTEIDSSTNNTVRKMTGVVRTSDVAVVGSIPNNWNPFSLGVNTADEFTLSDTSIIQDLKPLGDNLFIYTNDSIHVMRLTGSLTAPVSFRPVTYQYGCLSLDCTIEFNGRHLVVGSNDIYTFSGNPSGIESVSDMRVRDYFYSNLNRDHTSKIFLLRNQPNDEIWVCYPKGSASECTEALIYNFKHNTWTIRTLNNIASGVMAPIVGDGVTDSDRPWADDKINMNKVFPVLAQVPTSNVSNSNATILAADVGYKHRSLANAYVDYTSYLERKGLSATPEFKTEQFNSVALLTQGSGTLNIKAISSNAPAAMPTNFNSPDSSGTFTIATDYKNDLRLSGRFISYRIDDGAATSTEWSLTGLQLAVQEGGTR